ncbi:hypothetical protein FA09DRAFT_217550 [Tilletiopsis washingtonensis]|uniref:Uncharacterized protein n=1 Tax=Tilletiopsis washingtonensis TaxID=58919 RepID=A0A316ZFF1_9BASI|nr:hypothetical protein FA09DRAFT_217550 [Tilletiopsis washingtonensis]PWN99748.1 hypothetical protein FA09DRAFT_217550 [Tilletiopsis washingtonensis]
MEAGAAPSICMLPAAPAALPKARRACTRGSGEGWGSAARSTARMKAASAQKSRRGDGRGTRLEPSCTRGARLRRGPILSRALLPPCSLWRTACSAVQQALARA